MKLSHSQSVLTMVAVTLMWSIAGVVSRQLEQTGRFEASFWRSLFTVLSLLVVIPLLSERGAPGVYARFKVARGHRVFWLSGLCWSVMFTAFMVAMMLTSVAAVLVTMAAGPLITAVLARIALGHQLPRRTWLAIVVAGAGITGMYGVDVLTPDPSGARWLGMLVALCVPMAAAVQWTLVQRQQQLQHAHAAAQTGAALVSADLVLSILLGAAISAVVCLPWALPIKASAHDLVWLATLGLVQLAIPCVLSVMCAGTLQAPEVSLLALLEVIFGIVLAWWGANEVPGASVLLGGSLVLGALGANEWLGWKTRRMQ
jgi:drug/metabolite transporter (DMT)-like permease